MESIFTASMLLDYGFTSSPAQMLKENMSKANLVDDTSKGSKRHLLPVEHATRCSNEMYMMK